MDYHAIPTTGPICIASKNIFGCCLFRYNHIMLASGIRELRQCHQTQRFLIGGDAFGAEPAEHFPLPPIDLEPRGRCYNTVKICAFLLPVGLGVWIANYWP